MRGTVWFVKYDADGNSEVLARGRVIEDEYAADADEFRQRVRRTYAVEEGTVIEFGPISQPWNKV